MSGARADSCWSWRSSAVTRRNVRIRTEQKHMYNAPKTHCNCTTEGIAWSVFPSLCLAQSFTSYSVVSVSCTVQVQSSPRELKHLPSRAISLFLCCFTLLFLLQVLLIGQPFTPSSYWFFILDSTMFCSAVFLLSGRNTWWSKKKVPTDKWVRYLFANSVGNFYIIFL